MNTGLEWNVALAIITVPALAFFASACASRDPANDDEAASALEDATEGATDSVTFADILAGGKFVCRGNGGDIVISLTPPATGNRFRAELTGRVLAYDYPADDPQMELKLAGAELAGTRSLNYGDIGHGYYCGGGSAAYNCGPDRTDRVRFFTQGSGELRCEVAMDRGDGPWVVLARPTRFVTPPPMMFGSNTGKLDVPGATTMRTGLNYLSGFQVKIPKTMTLQQFGVVTVRGPGSPPPQSNVVMALYADDRFNHPGALVASTASTLVSGGDQKIPPNAEVTLPAGTYWVMGEFDRATWVWSQTQRSSFPSAWVNHTFGTTLPTRFPSPFSYIPDYYPGLHMGDTTLRQSFYIVAQ